VNSEEEGVMGMLFIIAGVIIGVYNLFNGLIVWKEMILMIIGLTMIVHMTAEGI